MKSILCVDDETIMLNSYRTVLDRDYELTTKQSGEDVLSWLGENDIDLIFIDYVMPAMDGLELTRKIRKAGITAPIVMVTSSWESADLKETAELLGVNDVINKTHERITEMAHKYLYAD